MLDFDADGLINFHEFSKFSKAWLSYDPNHPSPPSDPNVFINWNAICDLEADLHINLADLELLLDDWLWTACWKLKDLTEAMMMSGGGEGMMMEMLSMETFSTEMVYAEPEPALSEDEREEDPYTAMSMPEIVSMVKGINVVLEAADTAIAENDENVEDWLEIRDFLRGVLLDIRESRQ